MECCDVCGRKYEYHTAEQTGRCAAPPQESWELEVVPELYGNGTISTAFLASRKGSMMQAQVRARERMGR